MEGANVGIVTETIQSVFQGVNDTITEQFLVVSCHNVAQVESCGELAISEIFLTDIWILAQS